MALRGNPQTCENDDVIGDSGYKGVDGDNGSLSPFHACHSLCLFVWSGLV